MSVPDFVFLNNSFQTNDICVVMVAKEQFCLACPLPSMVS